LIEAPIVQRHTGIQGLHHAFELQEEDPMPWQETGKTMGFRTAYSMHVL
jgi:hypothetical protein